jgi:hypothetical protein
MNLELKTRTELCRRIGIKKLKWFGIPRECGWYGGQGDRLRRRLTAKDDIDAREN